MSDATTLEGLLIQRDTAGARYAAAVQELHDAYVDLAGLDIALANSSVGGGLVHGFPPDSLAALPEILRHQSYATGAALPDWRDTVRARGDQLVRGIVE
jgi:hypothetical protein